jgi:hypothetical protein
MDGVYRCHSVPACGRPFLVDGLARRAHAIERADWLDPTVSAPPSAELSRAERTAVTEHWLEAGAMEHASIAAFARFSLELLALGAPADLVAAATRAMSDETAHARLAYGIAARYAETPCGPAPLNVARALERIDLLDVVERALLEGCLGETSAALEAAWAADDATDPIVREALERIATDEARHAALAFEFVAWAAAQDARVTELGRRVLATAAAELVPETALTATSLAQRRLAEHGVLPASVRQAARRAALRDVVPAVWAAVRTRESSSRPAPRLESRPS